MGELRGWYSRGRLPHFEGGELCQFVTFTLVDALPEAVLVTLDQELHQLPDNQRSAAEYRRLQALLDQGHGQLWLRIPALAKLVGDALAFFDGERYCLHAWVVMPNHVHALLTPLPEHALSSIIHSWKTYTARRANAYLGREGRFWQREYYDRFIRHERHFRTVANYIEGNPVAAGLCEWPDEWPWGSAAKRRRDG